jgi:hypothetical protein
MPKNHHGGMKQYLNSKGKHNLGRMASPLNPSTKLMAFYEKSMAEPN